MTSGSHLGRVEALFESALELDPPDRSAYVHRESRDDPELRQEVLELLASDRDAEQFFDQLHGDIASSAQQELDVASRPKIEIGPWRAVELLGRGGMGVVYRAERADGAFEQQVALKLLHLDLLSPEMQARFAAERQLLAQLSHPNIARLQDGGVTDEGRPYFVMEYVEGQSIDRWVAAQQPSLNELLGLFLEVVGAVSYLHRNLIVHRDLKPSNLLVDGDGTVKLLDFGIAKLLASSGETVAMTNTGSQLLTPRYAAPEQLAGSAVTTSTDVYSLGLLLYELLVGEPARAETTGKAERFGAESTTAPSIALRRRATEAPSLAWRRIAGDLDTICLKAMRREPERRYSSAEQLGEDIERFLAGQPVRARKSTLSYRVASFARRNRAGVAVAGVMAVLIVFGFFRERGLRNAAEDARRLAEIETAKAVSVSDFLSELLSSSDPSKAQGAVLTVSDVLAQAAERLDSEHALADQPEVEAGARLTLAKTYMALGRPGDALDQLRRAEDLLERTDASPLEKAEVTESMALALVGQALTPASFETAEEMLWQVLEVRRSALGEDHPSTLTTLGHLARRLRDQERYDEAEQVSREVLSARRRALGEDHPDTLLAMNSVGGLLFQTGDYSGAVELYRPAHAAALRALGNRHPLTLRLGSNLGAALHEQGRPIEAEEVLRSVVEGRVEVLGESHPSTAMSLHNLAAALMLLARYEEAESYLERSIAARYQGDSRPGYLYSRAHLADLYRDQGRYGDAEAIYLETYAEQLDRAGPKDPDSLRTASSLAELLYRTGRLDEAEDRILEVRAALATAAVPGHPAEIGPALTLARIRNAQGRFAEGLEIAREARVAAVEALGAEHPTGLEAQLTVAESLVALGRSQEAAQEAEAAHGSLIRVLGPRHPLTVRASGLLAEP